MKFGFHAVYEKDYIDAISFAADHGFNYVQFDLNCPRYFLENLSQRELKKIKQLSQDTGVEITFHAPGDNIGLFTDYPPIRKGLLTHLRKILNYAEKFNSHHITVHPFIYPSFHATEKVDKDYECEFWNYYSQVLQNNLSEILKKNKKCYICVENYKFTRLAISAIEPLLSVHKNLGLTLDIPKLFDKSGKLDTEGLNFFRKNAAKIKEIHLHDFKFKNRSHLGFGDGDIDFSRFIDFFSHSNDHYITIEVRPGCAAYKTLGKFKSYLEGCL